MNRNATIDCTLIVNQRTKHPSAIGQARRCMHYQNSHRFARCPLAG